MRSILCKKDGIKVLLLDIFNRIFYGCFMFFSRTTCILACVATVLSFTKISRAAVVTDPPALSSLPDVGASSPLTGLAYSPDGTVLYTLGITGELIGRNVNDQHTVFRGDVGNNGGKIRVLPDGSLLIGREDGNVSLYEKPAAGKSLVARGAFPAPEPKASVEGAPGKPSTLYQYEIENFVPSPNDALLAVAVTQITWNVDYAQRQIKSRDALLQVWDMKSKSVLHSWEAIPLTKLHSRPGDWDILHLAWEKGGKVLDVAMPDVTIQRFNPHTGTLLSEWKPSKEHLVQPNPAAKDAEMKRRFSTLPPDMRAMALEAYEKRNAASKVETPPTSFGQTYAISPDGMLMLAASRNSWQILNTKSNSSTILEHTQHRELNNTIHFSVDGTMLVMYSEGWFWMWKADGTLIGRAQVPFVTLSGIAFSPHNTHLALADDTGNVRQWKIASPLTKMPDTVFSGFFAPWRNFRFNSNLKLAATDRFVATLDSKGHPHWFARELIKSPSPLSENQKNQTRMVIDHIAAAPDGKSWAEGVSFEHYSSTMITAGFPSGELRVRDANTGQIMRRQEAQYPMSHLEALQFLPDGTLLSGGEGHERSPVPLPNSLGGLQVHDAQSGELKSLDITWDKQKGHLKPNGVTQLLTSKDGKRLVVCSDLVGSDIGIQVIDMVSKKIVLSFGGRIGIERGKWALSPDGRWLGIAIKHRMGSEDHIYLRDLNEPQHGNFLGPALRLKVLSPAQAISFNNDGSFAVGLEDGRVLMFAANPTTTSKPIWETKPGRTIDALQFSADGKTLWSGDERGDLVARNAIDGQWKSTLRLLPPTNEIDAPSWARWERGGKIEFAPK